MRHTPRIIAEHAQAPNIHSDIKIKRFAKPLGLHSLYLLCHAYLQHLFRQIALRINDGFQHLVHARITASTPGCTFDIITHPRVKIYISAKQAHTMNKNTVIDNFFSTRPSQCPVQYSEKANDDASNAQHGAYSWPSTLY